jgi:hypothetical protein
MKHGHTVFNLMIVFALVACVPLVALPTTSPAIITNPISAYPVATIPLVPYPVIPFAVSQPIPTSVATPTSQGVQLLRLRKGSPIQN